MNVRRLFAALFVTLVLAGGFVAGRASADQPHMQSALEHLRLAKTELDLATADKGGHRANALKLVKEAMTQVEEGIRFDRRH